MVELRDRLVISKISENMKSANKISVSSKIKVENSVYEISTVERRFFVKMLGRAKEEFEG